jgi:exodeoxyribonuclease V alpha subunit
MNGLDTKHTLDLDRLQKIGFLSPLDVRFAGFMETLSRGSCEELAPAAALVSKATREGHICLDLALQGFSDLSEGRERFPLPPIRRWNKALRACGVVGEPGEYRPLILDKRGRLYLYRYWEYQAELAKAVQDRIRREHHRTGEAESMGSLLDRLFPGPEKGQVDWQKIAAFAAARRPFCVIAGGPGTGKTTTVAKVLALLVEQSKGERLRIALVSPTGKGAVRLREAMNKAREALPCDEGVKAVIPDKASTIHRLLGPVGRSPYFDYHARHLLPVDVLVVDEASMVDMALMSKLAQALPAEARFILLGDKDQLSSVEAGAVLGDICDTGISHPFSRAFSSEIREVTGYDIRGVEGTPGMSDSIVQLTRSYRFGDESGIACAARSINQGDGAGALRALQDRGHGDLHWRASPAPRLLPGLLKERVLEAYRDLFEATDPKEGFACLDRFRILCALREGPFGVKAVNLLVEHVFRQQKRIKDGGRWYQGRPILITQNDYTLDLYNGDTGIVLADPDSAGGLRAFFPLPDGTFRRLHPFRLPEHETVYAMTVHKSQGSELGQVLLILPDRDSPVLTRELIYTAVTRAREQVEIWGHEGVFLQAVSRRVKRTSGLRDALWEE